MTSSAGAAVAPSSALTRHLKVVLLGEGAVGKTSLMVRYVHARFDDAPHCSTVQAAFATRRVSVAGVRVQLAVWDTAGQERFHALGPIYYRDAHGALLVYDVSDAGSFAHVQRWVRQLREQLGARVQLVIVGNKADLLAAAVPEATARAYAQSVGAAHALVSAKTGAGVDAAFGALCRQMLAADENGAPSTAGTGEVSGARANRVVVATEQHADAENSPRRCC